MAKLTKIESIRFSQDDVALMVELRRLKVNLHQVIRISFREKLQTFLPKLLKDEEKRKSKEYCPF